MNKSIENVGGYRHGTVALGQPFLFLLKLALYGLIAVSVIQVVHRVVPWESVGALAGLSLMYLSGWVCAAIKKGELVPAEFVRYTLNTFPLTMMLLYAGVIASIAAAALLTKAGQSPVVIIWIAGALMLLVSVCEAALVREKMSIAEM